MPKILELPDGIREKAKTRLSSQIANLEKLSHAKRLGWYLSYFDDAFKEVMSEEFYGFARQGICNTFTFDSHESAITHKDLVKRYENELKFIKSICAMPSVPVPVCRTIALYFTDALEGKTKTRYPWALAGSSKENEKQEARKHEMIDDVHLAIKSLNNRRAYKPKSKLPCTFTSHFIDNEFYPSDLILEVTNKEVSLLDDNGLRPKITNAYLLKCYLILAKELNITKDIREQLKAAQKLQAEDFQRERLKYEITSMPLKRENLVKLIITETGLDKDQIYGRLKGILDKDHNPK